MMDNELIKKAADELESYVIETRRYLHTIPEVSGEEFKTREFLIGKIREAGLPFEEIEDSTGLIATLDTGRPGPHIALRADIDALPMPEEPNNLAGPRTCVSGTPNRCHACGHDGHMAMLLGSMKAMVEHKDDLNGIIYFCFEQGEEVGGGIQQMMKALSKYEIDTVWGIHVYAGLESGKISVQPGPRMAGAIGINFDFIGKGGHGSRPDQSINPVYCASNWYNNIAVAFANQIDANQTVTLGLTGIIGGEAGNVIPDQAKVIGSLRFFSVEEGEKAFRIVKETAEHTAAMHHCTVDFSRMKPPGYPVINDEKAALLAEKKLPEVLPEGTVARCEPWYASESFRMYLSKYPGVFCFVGINNPEYGSGAAHHNSFFDIDESVLKLGMLATLKYVAAVEENGGVK